MGKEKSAQQTAGRSLIAALIVAGSILGASFIQGQNGVPAILAWLATAIYMSGLLAAAWLLGPPATAGWWLFGTATLLGLTIVIPGAFLDPVHWAASQLYQLGFSAGSLFIVLAISVTGQPEPGSKKRRVITGFYVLIMLVLTVLL